jgi:hypothetical protein
MAKAKAGAVEAVCIPALEIKTFVLTLVGDTPLITNKFSEKAKQQMRDKQQGRANAGRAKKDPEADFRGSLYGHPEGGYGFPAIAFKAAAVDAATCTGSIPKTVVRRAFHIDCELVKIDGTPTIREDTVKVGMGTTDLRYRGEFLTWSTTFKVSCNPNVLSIEQIVNLFNIAGFSTGVGEWRVERDGNFGRFHVKQGKN